MPRLHLLKLPESPIADHGTNYERFRKQWILVGGEGTPPSRTPLSEEGPATTEKIFFLNHGDLVWFPDLQTGAGEFEGVYFVLRQSTKTIADQSPLGPDYVLHPCGVEGPEFPPAILPLCLNDTVNLPQPPLRTCYEPLFEKILQFQRLSLADLLGGADVVEEFWQTPPTPRPTKGPLPHQEDTWRIPLQHCTWIDSYEN